MPKNTRECSKMPDYIEAFSVGRNKGPVLFGHRPDLEEYYKDIDANQERSLYFGRVLYPENPARKTVPNRHRVMV